MKRARKKKLLQSNSAAALLPRLPPPLFKFAQIEPNRNQMFGQEIGQERSLYGAGTHHASLEAASDRRTSETSSAESEDDEVYPDSKEQADLKQQYTMGIQLRQRSREGGVGEGGERWAMNNKNHVGNAWLTPPTPLAQ